MTGHHLALVGTTASGKSALAFEVARARPDIEIVSVDSMQVYRGMDIGTAKPSAGEQREVRHHLIDLVEPSEVFTVAKFVELAESPEVQADGIIKQFNWYPGIDPQYVQPKLDQAAWSKLFTDVSPQDLADAEHVGRFGLRCAIEDPQSHRHMVALLPLTA